MTKEQSIKKVFKALRSTWECDIDCETCAYFIDDKKVIKSIDKFIGVNSDGCGAISLRAITTKMFEKKHLELLDKLMNNS